MFSRLVTLLAILAIAVFSTASSAHAAQRSAVQDHAMDGGEMIQAEDAAQSSCISGHCGSTGAVSCDVICSALPVFLPSESDSAIWDFGLSPLEIVEVAMHPGRASGPDERPPKPRLL